MEPRGGSVEDVGVAAVKLAAAILVLGAIGLPLLETWEALFLGLTVLALIFGDARPDWRRRILIAAVVVVAATTVKGLLPRADIAEAHNAFLVMDAGGALERGLPHEAFQSWKAQFDALYPPDPPPFEERSQWRNTGVPATVFAASTDAIWRKARYTRQVDAIEFRSLGEFRGGFANDLQYNFWKGELLREWMPFYVMYRLTPASVGSALAWKGQVFWEVDGGRYEEIVHSQIASKLIASGDVGKRVYAAFFPKRDADIEFRLEPSVTLRLGALLRGLLGLVAGASALLLLVRPRWPSYARAVLLFSTGYVLIVSFIWVSAGKYLGGTYPPQGGGDDGLAHDGWGRGMALLAGAGDLPAALQGFERVYWFTPGMRYVRMVEKLIFGDTNHMYALIVAAVPLIIFLLILHLTNRRWAWVGTAMFCFIPVGNPSFLQYIANAKLGYGEAFGGAAFLLAVVCLLRTEPTWGGGASSRVLVWIAGVALALSVFVRPNFAIAVGWLALAYSWAAWRRRDGVAIAVLAAGLVVTAWMPFHNWHYGGEIRMISASTALALPLGPREYMSAAADLLQGHTATPAATQAFTQLSKWLGNPGFVVTPRLRPFAWAAHVVKLLALLGTIILVARALGRRKQRTSLSILAVTALCAHVPMLFVFEPNPRYDMLGWDLSVLTLFAWCYHAWRPARVAPDLEAV